LNRSRLATDCFSTGDPSVKYENELSRGKLHGINHLLEMVTPERFNRGSSSGLAWIPAKNMRE
jgi:hypothetical protein